MGREPCSGGPPGLAPCREKGRVGNFFLNQDFFFFFKGHALIFQPHNLKISKTHVGQKYIYIWLNLGATSLRPLPSTVKPSSMYQVMFILMDMRFLVWGGDMSSLYFQS